MGTQFEPQKKKKVHQKEKKYQVGAQRVGYIEIFQIKVLCLK